MQRKRGRLAAAAWSKQHRYGVGSQVRVKLIDHRDEAETLGQVLDLDAHQAAAWLSLGAIRAARLLTMTMTTTPMKSCSSDSDATREK